MCLLATQAHAGSNDPEPISPAEAGLGLPWVGKTCGQNEVEIPGLSPTCERTCTNKKPICSRIYVVYDADPCFCKKGFFRDTTTMRCVPEDQCQQ